MRASQRRRAFALLAGAALALGGCSSVFEEPRVAFEGLRIGGLGLEGGRVLVRVSVVNPNSFGLEASAVDYDLDLRDPSGESWVDLAEGVYDEEIRVGGGDSVVVEIPVDFTYRQLGPALRSLLNRGNVDVRVAGSVDLEEPVTRRIPFRKEQNVSLGG